MWEIQAGGRWIFHGGVVGASQEVSKQEGESGEDGYSLNNPTGSLVAGEGMFDTRPSSYIEAGVEEEETDESA